MNRVILVGRITKDPEVKMTQSNIAVATFTLAVNRQFADQSGERQADFIQCVVWRKQAENLARFVKKGALLGVEGRIQTRQYEAENGMRYVTEVVCDSVQFLESKGDSNESTSRDDLTTADNDEFYETSKQLAAEEDLPF
ncbi:MAG TPA: single-stranded DNA-binding protein [Acholeplasmataceae bacterium]|nr:single-stranded DNA-binding protein [Acholeplasmataceae bacterium]HRX44638.1 single-stranded DNA-binding protein [Acholeplasmataceae bacterium]